MSHERLTFFFERFVAGLIGRYSDAQITKHFGLSPERIAEIASKYKMDKYREAVKSDSNRRVRSRQEMEAIRDQWEGFVASLIGKYSDAQIARDFHLSPERIAEIASKYKAEIKSRSRKSKSRSKGRDVEIDPNKTVFTPNEVAAMLGWSRDTVIRRFSHEPGVRVDGNIETTKERRRYRQLRIPKSVLNRVVNRKTVK
ncbi:MAG: hypothetical protein ABR866_05975 [Candidatus Korobacteraceae bacterium]|jgi:hypothetical protein